MGKETSARVEQRAASVPAPAVKAPPWRRVALCIKACSVYLGGALAKVYGGEWVVDAQQAKSLDRDHEHFRMVDVSGPDELALMLADHAKQVKALREMAASLGMVVFHQGEATPVKR